MAYATYQDAIELYGADYVLTSVARSGVDDVAALTKALVNASSEIDSYIAQQQAVPLVEPYPQIVSQHCIDIAIYRASEAGSVTDEKRLRYEDAIRWLRDVAKGLISLTTPGETTAPTWGIVETTGPQRAFSRASMRRL